MEKFLNGRIDGEEFYGNLEQFKKEIQAKVNKLESKIKSEITEINGEDFQNFNSEFLRLSGFGDLMLNLYSLGHYLNDCCENYYDDTGYLYTCIKTLFLHLQKVLYLDKRVEEEDLDKYEK